VPVRAGGPSLSAVQITHLGHSCVLVEAGGSRLVIDPGGFTPGWETTQGLDAVLVTHEHADHLDRDRLPALLARNPDARLVTEPGVAGQLAGTVEREPEALAAGSSTRIGGLEVTATGGRHAVIHADIPRIGNVGYLVAETSGGGPTLYHPGDMLEAVPEGVDVLAVPISAPWQAIKETVEFVRAIGAPTAFPIHDALLSPIGRGLYQRVLRQLTEGTELRDLADAGPVSL
jgi:L-ascorbate metabolism protein UlaG (beta-lactamase superfamily)